MFGSGNVTINATETAILTPTVTGEINELTAAMADTRVAHYTSLLQGGRGSLLLSS